MSALPSPAPRVLVIDDEALLATAITRRLSQEGYACRSAETLAAARQSLIDDNDQGQTGADIVLLDMRLPDGSGLDLLGELSATGPDAPPVIVVTAFGDVENAVAAMKLGAADYLRKPIDLDELIMVLDRVRAGAELRHQLEYSRQRDHHALEAPVLLGDSAAMVAARDKIDTVAAVETPDGASPPTVLITGETGTGKDVAARLIHLGGGRPQQPFIHVDCAALPAEMVEAELFGHVRGAFPGARSDRTGLIEAAEAGTLFLDEIGAFPADLQAKLLNVIERHRARRIGASREMPVRARFVAATNRQLADMVDAGTFRSDLYYRLNVLTVEMPPLRDCSGDVAVMAADFAAATARRYGRPAMEFDPAARAALTRYSWPGNVRELKHMVERAVLLSRSGRIAESDLGLDQPAPPAVSVSDDFGAGLTLEASERRLIENALAKSGGNVSEAARLLGITRMALRYRINKHRLAPARGATSAEIDER